MEIKFNKVSRNFAVPAGRQGGIKAVRDFSLTVPSRKLVAVLGPSGSGKSTLLALLTGLLAPDAGEIYLDNQLASEAQRIVMPPPARRIGMVFQTLALWPHLTVRKNLQFVLKGKCSQEEAGQRIDQLLALMDLTRYAGTYPPYLSGGEQQRVALARALVLQPHLLLLDEPLSNLDQNLAGKLLAQIHACHQAFNTTTLYVTHDQAEAFSLADLIAVIHQGQLMQFAPPEEIYQRPANLFVASFVGAGAVFNGEMVRPDLVVTPFGEINCLVNETIREKKVLVLTRPGHLKEDRTGKIKGRVAGSEFKGEGWLVTLRLQAGTAGDITCPVMLTRSVALNEELTLSLTQPVWVLPRT